MTRKSNPAVAALLAALACGAAAPAAGADVTNGLRLYTQYCIGCHGENGHNVMPGAPNFSLGERMLQPDVMLMNSIRTGKQAMPGFIGMLSDRQILDVVAYLRTLRR